MRKHGLSYFLAVIAIVGIASSCRGQAAGRRYGELLRRIPERANLLMLVDVDGLFDSPLGRGERWREKAVDQARGELGLPPTMARVAVASGVDLHDFQVEWRVGMAEYRDRLPDLATLAMREGGFVETIHLAKAAWTPRDLYFVTFEPSILGFVAPADRQAMARWINSTFSKPRTFPPSFADRAIYLAEAGSQIVLALNLSDSVAAPLIKPWVATLDGMEAHILDPALLAERLARATSAFLQVDVKQAIEGSIRLEFDREIDYAKPVAKALVLSALEEAGVGLDDLKTWSGGAEGKAIVLEGRLSVDAVRRILSLAHPPRTTSERPSLAGNHPADVPAVTPSREATQDDVVRASQGYFRTVADILDSLKDQKSRTYQGMKVWYERSAKQVEELPILGVDKELLDWGSKVARTLREMAYGINYSAKDQAHRIAGSGGGYYGGYGESRIADAEAIKKQSGATLSVDLDGRWQGLSTSVADMRRTMVEKYRVDF